MRHLFSIFFTICLCGCFLVPHKIDVQQGNFVDQKMISLLKLNMTRDQVVYVLGTPLVADPFHPDRWDYVFMDGEVGSATIKRDLTLIFENDKLLRIEKKNIVPSDS